MTDYSSTTPPAPPPDPSIPDPGEPGPPGPAPSPPLPDPDVLPSSTPDGPQIIPSPSTPPGEPGPDPDPPATDVRDSNPNGGPEGQSGSMGVSSERVPTDPGSIEGTGSRGSATRASDGTWHTHPEGIADEPDELVGDASITTGESWSGIDRTVGEPKPAEVRPHPFDRTKNRGHQTG